MAKKCLISQITQAEPVVIQGWISQIRILAKVAFLIIKDPSGIIQVVAQPEQLKTLSLKVEDVVKITGQVILNSQAKLGLEIQMQSVEVLNPVGDNLPFNSNSKNLEETAPEVILAHRPISLRNPFLGEVFQVQGDLVQLFRNFLQNNYFQEIFTSKIVSSGTEGGSNLFELKYFDKIAYLAQSPQFYKEYGTASFGRVFETGHVYRAEPHATSRHLTEYYSLDVEMGFIDNVLEVIQLEKELLTYIFQELNKKYQKIFEQRGLPLLPSMLDIPVWSFTEALAKLKEHYNRIDLTDDLDSEAERQLCSLALKECGVEAVFILGFPLASRPFYCHPLDSSGAASSFDLLFKGMEITSGGQRLHQRKAIESALANKGLKVADFSTHLQMYEQGMPPHGGFAIGLERLTALIMGLKNVKEASMWPRDRNRISP